MSILQQNFARAARAHLWDEALLFANRLQMHEMLQSLEELPCELVEELLHELLEDTIPLRETVNTARIAFAASVVKHQAIPAEIPDRLAVSGQVRDARDFLAARAAGGALRAWAPAVSRAGHLFPTPDAAACAAIDEILPALGPGSGAYGGFILQIPQGLYLYTRPARLAGDAGSGTLDPPNFNVLGVYYARTPHAEATEEELSAEDRSRAIRLSELLFVGTPGGRIVRFTPADMLPPEEQAEVASGRTDVLRVAPAAVAGPPERDVPGVSRP